MALFFFRQQSGRSSDLKNLSYFLYKKKKEEKERK